MEYLPTAPVTSSELLWPQTPLSGPVELAAERPPIAYVPDPHRPGQSVAIDARLLQAPVVHQPRDLTPQPLIDPRAQLVAAGGVLAAGTGWGIGQALSALAGIGSGALMWLAIAIVALKVAPALGRGSVTTTNNVTVTNNNRLLGRSHTTSHQG
jgi:hypothetical protein